MRDMEFREGKAPPLGQRRLPLKAAGAAHRTPCHCAGSR